MKLLLVDDHILFRESLGRMLASEPDFEIVGECGAGAEALQILARQAVDLVLLDFTLREMRGTELVSAARRSGYGGDFLIVTGGMDTDEIVQALQLGVSGIFPKRDSVKSLVQAIRLVAAGEAWLDRKTVQLLANQVPLLGTYLSHKPLTEREQRVLHGILEGLTNRTIAETLAVSEGAVKFALQQLFEKAGVRSRTQLVRAALQRLREDP